MAKRPDTLETLLLALELLRRIPRKNKITARELHEQLQNAGMDRDLRTIQRMLETFSEHFEIERDDRSKTLRLSVAGSVAWHGGVAPHAPRVSVAATGARTPAQPAAPAPHAVHVRLF